MIYVEFMVKFERPVTLEDNTIANFEKKALEIGFTNNFKNDNIRAYFDNNKNQVALSRTNFTYLMNKPIKERVENFATDVASFIGDWIKPEELFRADIRFSDAFEVEYNCFEKSIELYKGIEDNIKGVGYRYFIDTPYSMCDFKVEPFVRNPNFWFFEASMGYDKLNNVEDCKSLIDYMFKLFDERKKKFLSKLK